MLESINIPLLKARLMQTFKESENLKIKRLLTGLELDHTKPSQLLRRMRSLGDTDDISDKMLRTWLEKMPDAVKHMLSVSDEDLEKLATITDKILEMQPRSELASLNRNTVPVDELLNKFSALELQIAYMTARNSRYRSPSGNRSTSRKRSRKRFDANSKILLLPLQVWQEVLLRKMQGTLQLEIIGKHEPAASSVAMSPDCRKFRLFVKDRKTGLRFLVDLAMLIPANLKAEKPCSYTLYAANGTEIPTFGFRTLTLDLGLRRPFQWPFVVAKVSVSVQHLIISLPNSKLPPKREVSPE
ncbi:uncharacterized protein LOC118205875 [Stegodyphus dumicola]|uniref:uncharacterized protein LOC118205875 n=1 Tax=Stegodyphus dumicola TaxID=202533 RepID=UPI0015B1504A|nr:uncharacterized protein LOC118205875 [Stegodyphus dumicola]